MAFVSVVLDRSCTNFRRLGGFPLKIKKKKKKKKKSAYVAYLIGEELVSYPRNPCGAALITLLVETDCDSCAMGPRNLGFHRDWTVNVSTPSHVYDASDLFPFRPNIAGTILVVKMNERKEKLFIHPDARAP